MASSGLSTENAVLNNEHISKSEGHLQNDMKEEEVQMPEKSERVPSTTGAVGLQQVPVPGNGSPTRFPEGWKVDQG